MRFRSTRGGGGAVDFAAATLQGLAPDGGLFVPERWPEPVSGIDLHGLVEAFVGEGALAPHVEGLVATSTDLPAPLVPLAEPAGAHLLELFHGPTAAFKDFGAAFLGAVLGRLAGGGTGAPLTVLVATSGDTGGAVATALAAVEGLEVVVLYPRGRVSEIQERQIAGHPGVRAFAVEGSFDDCQRLAKEAFLDPELARSRRWTSANSINIARLVAQAGVFLRAARELQEGTGRPAAFAIPTGNLGNLVSALWARELGAPIGRVAAATNANRGLVDFLAGGPTPSGPARATLANAMDVAAPSNLERLLDLSPDRERLRELVPARAFDDQAIAELARRAWSRGGILLDPHTACGYGALLELGPAEPHFAWCAVATAHPAKFPPLAGLPAPELPPALAADREREIHSRALRPRREDLRAALGE